MTEFWQVPREGGRRGVVDSALTGGGAMPWGSLSGVNPEVHRRMETPKR
jgi:hypothetical protein